MLYMPETRVTGMAVDTDPFEKIVPALMRQTAELLEWDRPIRDEDVQLRAMYGAGYAIPSPQGERAHKTAGRTEGLFLDPVYTWEGLQPGCWRWRRKGSLRGRRISFSCTPAERGDCLLPGSRPEAPTPVGIRAARAVWKAPDRPGGSPSFAGGAVARPGSGWYTKPEEERKALREKGGPL